MPWDHLLAVAAIVVFPLYSLATWQGTRRRVARHGEPARLAEYREVLAWLVAFAGGVGALWIASGRSPGALGLRLPVAGPGSGAGFLLAGAFLALLLWQRRVAAAGRVDLEGVAAQLEHLGPLIPETARERRWFRAVSIAAGVSEELVWRGFLLWYLTPSLGVWGAAGTQAALFAVAHAYQGARQIPGVLGLSALLTLLRLLTGSLLLPVVVHALTDILQGDLAANLRRQLGPPPATVAAEYRAGR